MLYRYIAPIDIDPSVVTSNTVYYIFQNTGSQNIQIDRLNLQTMSATGSGNIRSMFGIARVKGPTINTGTVVSSAKINTNDPAASVNIRFADAGIDISSQQRDSYFANIAVRTGDGGVFLHYIFEDGFILAPTEGIVLAADGELTPDSSLHGAIKFSCKR